MNTTILGLRIKKQSINRELYSAQQEVKKDLDLLKIQDNREAILQEIEQKYIPASSFIGKSLQFINLADKIVSRKKKSQGANTKSNETATYKGSLQKWKQKYPQWETWLEVAQKVASPIILSTSIKIGQNLLKKGLQKCNPFKRKRRK